MLQFDFAMHRAGKADMQCHGNLGHALGNIGLLTGQLLPLFSKLPDYRGTYKLESHLSKLQAVEAGQPHDYAMKPVFVSLITGYDNDAGSILLQGVCVSPMAFNHPLGHDLRVCTGTTKGEAFDDTWAVMLVTQPYIMSAGMLPNNDYFPGIPWSSINACSIFRSADGSMKIDPLAGGRNQYNSVFHWNEYMARHAAEDNCGVNSFALNECKQVKNLLRKLLPPAMTLADSQAALKELRDAGKLQDTLTERAASQKAFGVRSDKRKTVDKLSGNDLRKCLLAELLLMSTPLQGALTGDVSAISLPDIPDTTGFFAALRSFLDEYRERQLTPVQLAGLSVQASYEAWFSRVFAAVAAAVAVATAAGAQDEPVAAAPAAAVACP